MSRRRRLPRPAALDLGPEFGRRETARRRLEEVDLADPSLDVLLAQEAVEEEEAYLQPDVLGRFRKSSVYSRTSRRRRVASQDVIARVSSRSKRQVPT